MSFGLKVSSLGVIAEENPKFSGKIRYREFNKFKTSDEAVTKLISDIKKFGIKMPDEFRIDQCYQVSTTLTFQGYGESVCYLINDLLNRELIKREFKF